MKTPWAERAAELDKQNPGNFFNDFAAWDEWFQEQKNSDWFDDFSMVDRAALYCTICDLLRWQETVDRSGMKFAQTHCSQCGEGFGPGNHGFSHCEDHKGIPIVDDVG